ncbi:hypothetical protein AK812_SmicGene39408 [Symbiodinium microadriaticum]|uniref:DUF7779 domain-containing protein n=1 Tax=Symbiodinium microadriaticum TaxID=2951 RepID=A0A1Q9CBK9_SYMMI|nr:hypothetical protein AK812_SmicGene39408 [Symbiodinium microadriaticum]CAE7251058.1 unnamed protein product [Symbiodinium sp. KB8]CAE7888765.1 unnamed protein product [Symbiodinium microadriaticum]
MIDCRPKRHRRQRSLPSWTAAAHLLSSRCQLRFRFLAEATSTSCSHVEVAKWPVKQEALMDDLEARLREPGFLCLVATSGLAGARANWSLSFYTPSARTEEFYGGCRAENLVTLQQGLAQLATRISRATEIEANHDMETLEKAALKAVRALEEELQAWVLVFDNAPNHETIKSWIPKQGGVVLVTSRSPTWDDTLQVPVFSEQESLELLERLVGKGDAFDGAKEVAEAVGHHPLALAQAGGWAKECNLGLRKYAELLSKPNERVELLNKCPSLQLQQDYEATIVKTVDLAVQALRTPFASQVFNVCAMAAPDNIPYELLMAVYRELAGKTSSETAFSQVLKELCDHSLISSAPEGSGPGSYCVHRLVQTVQKDFLLYGAREDTAAKVVSPALAAAAKLFDFDLQNVKAAKEDSAPFYSSMVLHVRQIATFARDFDPQHESIDVASLAAVLMSLAEYLFEVVREEKEAVDLLLKALCLDLTPLRVLKLRATCLLAKFSLQANFKTKQQRLEQLEDAVLQLSDEDCYGLRVEALGTAAVIYAYSGQIPEAQERLSRCDAIVGKHLRPQGPSLAEASFQEAVSVVADLGGDMQTACDASRRMYETRLALLGSKSMLTLHALRGHVMDCAIVRPEEGMSMGEDLVRFTEALMGADHHDTGFAYRVLAECAYEAECFKRAKECCDAARKVSTQVYFQSRVDTVYAAVLIDSWSADAGDAMAQQAVELQERCLKEIINTDGDSSSRLIQAYSRLAIARVHMGKHIEAKQAAERAMEVLRSSSAAFQQKAHFAYIGMAEACVHDGVGQAEKWYKQLEDHLRQWPPEHPMHQHVSRHVERSKQRSGRLLLRTVGTNGVCLRSQTWYATGCFTWHGRTVVNEDISDAGWQHV